MAPEVIMSLQYDAKAGELRWLFFKNSFLNLFCCRSLVTWHDRVPVFNRQSSIPSSHTTRVEKLLREKCKFGTEVSLIKALLFHSFLTYILSFFRLPVGTTPELTDLLFGLLRRNAKERMPFDVFFNHPFLQRHPPAQQQQASGKQS